MLKYFLIFIIFVVFAACSNAQISTYTNTTTLQNSDEFLLQRGSSYYKVSWQNLSGALNVSSVLTTGSVTSTHILDGTLANADYGSGSISLDKFQTGLKNVLLQKNVTMNSIQALYQWDSGGYGIILGTNNVLVVPTNSDTTQTYIPGALYKFSDGSGEFYLGFARELNTGYSNAIDRLVTVRYLQLNGYSDSAAAIGPNTVGSLQTIDGSLKGFDLSATAGIKLSQIDGSSGDGSQGAVLFIDNDGDVNTVNLTGVLGLSAEGVTSFNAPATKGMDVKISSQIIHSHAWDAANDKITEFYIQKSGVSSIDTFDLEIPINVLDLGKSTTLDSVVIQVTGDDSKIDSCQIVSVDFGTLTKRDQVDNSVNLDNFNENTVKYAFNYKFVTTSQSAYFLRIFFDVQGEENLFVRVYNVAFYFTSI